MQHADLTIILFEGILVFLILYKILSARAGRRLFIRRIPGLSAIDEAVGRATEMGKPMIFSPGISGFSIVSLQALSILGHVIKSAAKYRARIIVPVLDSILYTITQESARDAYEAEGVPDAYNPEDIRFMPDNQFAYTSGVIGMMHREQVASVFYFGDFFAEALILAENGRTVGAIQIAGTPQITQIPFFIATCDYTIIGDEYYAASAYLSREPTLLGSLVGQDYGKAVILGIIVLGIIAASVLAVSTWPSMEHALVVFREAFQKG